MKIKNVLIVGLGEIGTALSEIIKDHSKYLLQTRDLTEHHIVLPIDIMHICYPWTETFIETTVNYMTRYKPKLTIIESTVLPQTTRMLWDLTHKMPIVHSPVRGSHKENIKSGLLRYTKFIGGICDNKYTRQAEHYYQTLGLKTCVCKNSLTTEFIKILSTTYYGLLITWWQEIRRISNKFRLSENEIRQWFLTNTLESNFQHTRPIMYPGKIGGHCVLPNLNLLKQVFPSKFIDVILESNEKAKENEN